MSLDWTMLTVICLNTHHTLQQQRHKLTPFFWYVCDSNLESDLSGTWFRRRLEHCFSKPHDWSDHLWVIPFQLTFGYSTRYNNSGQLGKFIMSLSAMIIVGARNFHSRHYMVRKTGARKWSWFMPWRQFLCRGCNKILATFLCLRH